MIYLDTSLLTAILLQEKAHNTHRERIAKVEICSSLLLEAEVLSVLIREKIPFEAFDQFSSAINWINPTRSLKPEIHEVLSHGYLGGADLWHVATALYAFEDRRSLEFFSLDKSQRAIAAACGLKIFPHKL